MSLHPRIENPWTGSPILVKERTTSTMDDAFALVVEGFPSGTVAVAGFQEAGRGRVPGRRWTAAPWESLLATLILRDAEVAFPGSQLPLRTGLAVCRAVESVVHSRLDIKWPNDLLWAGKKLAGVLCEHRSGAYLVGIGVNCRQQEFPPDLDRVACSIAQAGAGPVDPFELLPTVLARVKEALGDDAWREALHARLHGRGSRARVELVGSSRALEGTIEGIDEDGALILLQADGSRQRVPQGELRTGG